MMLPFALAAVLAGDPSTTARTITVHEQDIVPISVQVGMVTEIDLPKNEVVMTGKGYSPRVGNTEFFEVNASGNVLYIKARDYPGYGGEKTNVSITLTSGNHMSFLVSEVSKIKGAHADLKVIVEQEGTEADQASHPQFVPVSELTRLQSENEALKQKAAPPAKAASCSEQVMKQVNSLKFFSYEMYEHKGKGKIKPIITNDDTFTYVAVEGQEIPAVWAIRDGKTDKVQLLYQGGKYQLPLVDELEVRIGKESMKFRRKEG
jgi:type IV secretory pathway VirB9-like protein